MNQAKAKLLRDFGTHFVTKFGGYQIMFPVGECPRCKGVVMEANPITAECTPKECKEAGLIQLEALPPEIWPTEGGDYACDECNEAGDAAF